jgi:hypothetical protein
MRETQIDPFSGKKASQCVVFPGSRRGRQVTLEPVRPSSTLSFAAGISIEFPATNQGSQGFPVAGKII